MARATRLLASAATVGSLMVVGAPGGASAQSARPVASPVARASSFAPGGILGIVRDDRGAPVPNVVVSALGATTTIAVTDGSGRFEFQTLTPGPYLLRAHLAGYLAPRAQSVQVNPSGRSRSAIALRRSASAPILAAGIGTTEPDAAGATAEPASSDPDPDPSADTVTDPDETAWRLRHARRSVLKDVTIPVELLADGDHDGLGAGRFIPIDFLGRIGTPARAATNFFLDTDFSGQVNLLTTGSFDTPEQLFSADSLTRNIAYVRLGAPAGSLADWTARGAVNQADISSWVVAGTYSNRAAARHRYDIDLSYSTQRYDGGNLLALREVTDGSRNVGTVSAYDSFTVTPALTLGYGAAYSRYDYLENRSLLSPRMELTVTPAERFRVSAAVSRRALAPGAEEFLPPADTGIWLPPQRTFSSLPGDQRFSAEYTTHADVSVERDFGASTVGVGAFRQHVDDQLVTLFGVEIPGQPVANLGHYLVGSGGDVDATGCTATFRTVLASRVHGSVEYSVANATMTPSGDVRYLLFMAPSRGSSRERVHDLSTSIETEVPETATRVLVLYRVGNGFAGGADGSSIDSRFDVQVRQSLPFMNFSNARWEMLLAVRNFFREAGQEQSIYDELLVVRPPKRVVGGVSLRF